MIFKKKDKESKPKKEKKVPVMKVGTHKKTVIALWLVLITSVSFGVYKNFTAIDMHTVHEKEVIEQRIVDTNRIENFVKAFAKSYYSWSNTQESIDKRTAAINNYLTKSLQDLNVDTVRQDIPTSSTVTDVKIWDIEQAGTDDFTVVYSVDQTVTEGETSIGYTSANMVVVHVDSNGNMVITQNPTISSTPTKSSYEPKTKESDGTVDAATTVIDDPATGLMYNRFGSRANEVPGDVYWDLFRKNNQNRGSGNTEGIWVIQIETDTPGGSGSLTAKDQTNTLERHHAPMVRDVKAHGMNPFSWPIGDYTGGRGIGWAISTRYFSDEIWKDDFYGDMRNANHNFVRKFAVHNKEYAKLYGDTIDTQNPPVGVTVPSRSLYAYQSKCTTPYNHPEGLYSNSKTFALNSGAGATYTDQYMFRLAETYLLRAEAYLALNDKDKAAADINVIRNRAHAKPVLTSQVTLDYILDERMRELGVEERRRITLMRMGKLYDRVMKCNP